ncbi:STAS domain-containing protein [Streptomyces hyaluromycini]|uniref:STAS domain-containing protein n=1 Tax=Streptomyces hyaluromycini TaxID=1377993 RepID=UPI000D199AF0|nr:STAS domain-containing protein [Streptomyces hyaluromycini]
MRSAAPGPGESPTGPAEGPRPSSPGEPRTPPGEAPALFEECRIVRAYGELDAQTVAPLVRALAEVRAARPGRLLVIVDLSEVTFADCSILPPLCQAWADCRARGGWIRVVYDNHTTHLVFRSTGMLSRFPAYANAQDAWEGRTADTTAYRARIRALLDGR